MQDQPMELNDDDLDHVTGGTSVNGAQQRPAGTELNGLNIANIDLSSMDIETALMAVQSQRSQMLEEQLKGQLEAVNARNTQIASLNNTVASLNGDIPEFEQLTALFKDSDGGHATIALTDKVGTGDTTVGDLIKSLSKDYGLDSDGDGKIQKADLEKAFESNEREISQAKHQVDALGNSQQMEMLKLQSLTQKRNEAFDTMTQFIKKMQDSRSSIIGNMR